MVVMMVRVMYHDGMTEMVRPPVLQHLIRTGKIHKFRRSDGWAILGVDPMRTKKEFDYRGQERRKKPLMSH
ncbi:MAG: hypothetical protein C0615_04085 [Desulfuromonas sp.]|nr:MAG: hypothetical protein C0615_04085 [Desulfuromonas sp.]